MLAWKKPNLTIRNLHHGYIYRYIGKTVIKHDINCMGGGEREGIIPHQSEQVLVWKIIT